MPRITASDTRFLDNETSWFHGHFHQQFAFGFTTAFSFVPDLPREVQSVLDELVALRGAMQRGYDLDITDKEAGLLRQAVLKHRLFQARSIEQRTAKVINQALDAQLRSALLPYDRIISQDWFVAAPKRRLPRLTDYLGIEHAENALDAQKEPAREYDEKFQILQAPALFLQDLDHFRRTGELRDLTFAVAFIDIDDFKRLNTTHTEPRVDRTVLPTFMRCVESHIFERGYAYRQGGDEYIMLVNNTPEREAIAFVDELRRKIAGLDYGEIPESTTVSIGLVCADQDCHLTSGEIVAKAAIAKKAAKDAGKNCIATYKSGLFDDRDLHIISGIT